MKYPNELKKAILRGGTALETRTKIKAAIETAIAAQPAVEARLQAAMEELGSAEADAALESTPVSDATRTALTDARMADDALRARIQALNRKLDACQSEIAAVAVDAEAAHGTFAVEVLADYRNQLNRAAAEFSAVLKQGAALGDALGFSHVEMAIRRINVSDPTGTDTKLVDLDPREYRNQQWTPLSVWAGDSAAEAAYKAHAEPHNVIVELRAAQ